MRKVKPKNTTAKFKKIDVTEQCHLRYAMPMTYLLW